MNLSGGQALAKACLSSGFLFKVSIQHSPREIGEAAISPAKSVLIPLEVFPLLF